MNDDLTMLSAAYSPQVSDYDGSTVHIVTMAFNRAPEKGELGRFCAGGQTALNARQSAQAEAAMALQQAASSALVDIEALLRLDPDNQHLVAAAYNLSGGLAAYRRATSAEPPTLQVDRDSPLGRAWDNEADAAYDVTSAEKGD